ncbi:MAG: hypothetical protein IPO63_07890 [Bacteroidetes bacterium]|nr:hypothetical protein [Bacteroidota bacterium]
MKEQKSLMNKLDSISAETQKLEAIYQQKINDLEALKKSVLQKAFSGELKTNEVIVNSNDVSNTSKKKQNHQ